MFTPHYAQCISCREHKLVVVKKMLCEVCNQKLKSGRRKTPQFKAKRKRTGEGEVFMRVWNERPHYCTVCTKHLSEPIRTYYFMHIVPKGRLPEARLDEENIALGCFECHRTYDQGLPQNNPLFGKLLKKKEEIEQKYNLNN